MSFGSCKKHDVVITGPLFVNRIQLYFLLIQDFLSIEFPYLDIVLNEKESILLGVFGLGKA